MNVPYESESLTFNDLLNNAVHKQGSEHIFHYNAISANCQIFIADLLQSSNLLTHELKYFVYQPINVIIQQNGILNKFFNFVTDLGNRFKTWWRGGSLYQDLEQARSVIF
jgi:hypothetical protein